MFGALAAEEYDINLLHNLRKLEKLLALNDQKIINRYCLVVEKQKKFLTVEELKKYFGDNNIVSQHINVNKELTLACEYIDARNIMIKSNLRLVLKEAQVAFYDVNTCLDIIEEGNIGLIIAVNKFDVDMNYKFSTYATWWIRQGVSRAVYKNNTSFGAGVEQIRKALKLKKDIEKLEMEKGRLLSNKEVAQMLNIPYSEVVSRLGLLQANFSIDQSGPDEDKDITILDTLLDEDMLIEDKILQEELKDSVNSIFKELDSREQFIIKNRFGINTEGVCYTLNEVGDMLNLNRERIRQIEKNAMNKIKIAVQGKKEYSEMKMFWR